MNPFTKTLQFDRPGQRRRPAWGRRLVAVLAGVIAALWVSGCEPRTQPPTGEGLGHGHGHGHGPDDHEDHATGPHGGRLLEDGDLQVEIAIFESGIPPEFRLFLSGPSGDPLPVDNATAEVRLERFGGRIDTIPFVREDGFLRGQEVVEEPHSFDVSVMVRLGDAVHKWTYESPEARTEIEPESWREAGVELALAGPEVIHRIRRFPGEVKLNRDLHAQVVSRFKGFVTEIRKTLGDSVEPGETMAVVDSRELATAKSEYIEAVHHLELAQMAFLREQKLWRKKVSPEQDYQRVRHDLEEAEIQKQTALQKLLALGLKAEEFTGLAVEPEGGIVPFQPRTPFPEQSLTRYEIKAPIGGAVIAQTISLGSPVEESLALYSVADLSSVWVDATVHTAELNDVRAGQSATIRAVSLGQEDRGRISYIGPVLDERNRSSFARIVLPNPAGHWRPGLFVDVAVELGSEQVKVAVPPSALQTINEHPVVFLTDGRVFQAIPVRTGRRDEDRVEIVSGLEPGDRYVAKNSFLIKADILKAGATHSH